MTIPDWLRVNPSDYLRAAQEGASTGIQVGHLRQSAAELAQRAADAQASRELAAQTHADNLALQSWESNQRMAQQAQALASADQYHQGELGYRTGMLKYHLGKEAQAEKLQSDVNADTAGFLKEISSGENLSESLGRHPLASHDPTVRTILTQQAIADRGGPQGSAEVVDLPGLEGVKAIRQPSGHMTLVPGKKELNASLALPEINPVTGQPMVTLKGPLSQIAPYAGTNVPSLKLDKGGKRVRVQSKDGKIGTIPEEQLDDALKAGYKAL